MDDLNVENVAYNVIPVTEYDPFEAKFAASLYWLVFHATEDGTFEDIPFQVTSPVQRDSEKRITVRPEVTEFLTNGEIYCKVFNSIFHAEDPVVGQWAILHGLSRHGFYVVEEGDLAVTDSALQQKRPFRKSTHLALMDCLMNAYSSQVVTVEQVVASVSKFSSFNASKELPFDLEDAVLLWINKVCSALNEDQHKKQRQHAEQLLRNQDKAKRFRFRRDQLQPKVQTMFPVIDELLKDISDGQSLLGILMFYHPSVIKLEDIRFGNDLSTKDSIHNLDLFRSLCSQFICTSVLALKLEDLLYGSLAMKPNVVALLSEMFYKCEEEILSENGMDEIQTSKSDLHLKCLSANKENLMDNGSSSVPTLSSGERIENSEYDDSRDVTKARSERSSSLSGQFVNSDLYNVGDQGKYKRSRSESHMIANRQSEFKSPFQLDFTADPDFQQPLQNTPTPKQVLETEKNKKKENPFSGIFQRPVLAGESRKCSLPNMLGGGGSPRSTPRQESPLLLRRTKQKQRTLDLEEWDMQQEEVEDKSILQRFLQELHLRDAQRSQSLTGLDKARLEPRQSFHAWQENTGASLSDTNLASSRIEKISLDFKPDSSKSAPQREGEGVYASVRSSNLRPSSKSQEEHVSQDSLSSSPKTTDNQLIRTSGNFKMETKESFVSGPRDSCRSDISAKELSQFEEIEAMVLAGRSVETPRRFVKASKTSSSDNAQEDEDELDTSVSSDDMSKFRLEVLQRLTEDKLRQIPDGAEMEDDDDPILLARNNAVSSPRDPQQCTRLEVQENAPNSVSVDQLSPITETTEPFSSAASIRNSVSSPNSTAPSSPCSPLDVAPFMPEFFTTSPANTLDRQKQRGSSVSKEEGDRTVTADLSDPTMCQTPRNQRGKTADNSPKSRSFEQLARGSYTVGHVSVESAKAAGIPVITELTSEEFGRMTDSRTSSSDDVFGDRKFSAKSSQSSRDLSGIRELFLTSASVESEEIPVETNRRDSLDCTPPQSPSLTRDQETRESIDHRHSSSITIGSLRALDSPGDVVIYEWASLSSASHVNEQDSAVRDRGGHAVDHAPGGGKTVIRPKKSDAFVFDFNQHAVNEYHGADAPDYRTYRKGSKQIPQVTQGKDSVEPIRRGLGEEPNSIDHASNLVDEQSQQRTSDQHRTGENHEFVVDADVPDAKTRRFQVSGAKTTALDVRRSDGFTTYRKGAAPITTNELLAQFSEPSIKADRFHTIVKSSTSQGGMRYGDTAVQRHSSHAQSSHERDISVRPFPSSGGEGRCVDSSGRKGADEGDIPVSGSSNIVRSRTFRKKPDGQIIDEDVRSSSTSGYDGETPSTQNAIAVSGQQTAVTHVRGSPEGAGCEHPQRISWSDDSGSQDTRHLRQIQAERTSHVITPVSPRRTGSPRQTGRGSPGARISWLTAAKSGVGGQVILNEKGCMQEENTNTQELVTNDSSDALRRLKGALVIRDQNGCFVESDTWRTNEQGAKRAHENLDLRDSPSRNETLAHCKETTVNGSLSKSSSSADVGVAVINRCVRPEGLTVEMSEDGNCGVSSEHTEQEWLAGRSIRDRIAALSAAAGVSGLESSPVREKIRNTLIKAVSVVPSSPSNNRTTRKEQTSSTLNNQINENDEKAATKKSVAFDVVLKKAASSRPSPHVVSSFGSTNAKRNNEVATEITVVEAESDALEKAATFELPLNGGEPNAKHSREETVLKQSPFRVLKTRGKTKITTEPSQPTATETNAMGKFGEMSADFPVDDAPDEEGSTCNKFRLRLESKHKVFTFPWSSQPGSKTSKMKPASSGYSAKTNPSLMTVAKRESEETRGEPTQMPQQFDEKPPKLHHDNYEKPDAFGLDTETQSAKDEAIGAETTAVFGGVAKQDKPSRNEHTSQARNEDVQSAATNKSVAFDVGFFEASSSRLPRRLASRLGGDNQGKKNGESATETVQGPQQTLQKRSTFTIDKVSQSEEDMDEKGPQVSSVLADLVADGADDKQSLGDPSLKRNTFTLDTAPHYQDDLTSGVSCYVASPGFAEGSQLWPLLPKGETAEPPSDASQKRNTFTLDTSLCLADNEAYRPYLPEDDEQRTLALESVTPSSSQQKRNTFTLDTVSQAEDDEQRMLALEDATPSSSQQKRNTFTLDTVSQAEDDEQRTLALEDATPSSSQQKRNTFTLDTVSQAEDDEQRTLALEDATPSSSQQKRNTFTLDTVSPAVTSVLRDPVTGEANEQKALQCNIETSDNSQKRNTFTLETVSNSMENASGSELAVVNALRELATLVDNKRNPVESEFGLSRRSSENPQKRNTFTLDTVSHSVDCANGNESTDGDLGKLGSQEDCKETLVFETPRGVVQKSYTKQHIAKTGIGASDTFLENEGDVLISGEKRETKEKRSTFTLDSVSLSLQSGVDQGLPVVDILDQLTRQDICSSYLPDVEKPGKSEESAEKRGTFTLDPVVKSLEDAEQRGIPVVDALDKLATAHSTQRAVSSSEDALPDKSRQTRGTYTLDTVSQAIEEAVEKGIPISETLNHIAQEGEKTVPATRAQNLLPADILVQGHVQIENKDSASPGDRDEIEASFENALEQLEECETFDSDESCAVSSRQHQTQSNRGTYTLDDVSKSLQDSIKEGVPVAETLQRLSRTRSDSKDGAERIPPTDQKRGTYTLDDVSLSLKTASEKGVPVVQALENVARTVADDDNTKPSMGKRGTYTLEEVSQSLEQAKKTGIPVIETLGTLSKAKPKGSLRLKIPERGVAIRGTYTLDKVSHTLERAKERGLPVVDALSRVAGPEGAHLRQTSAEAVHRRQGKLTNRKTYALASPLETIGEDRKLHLYDGSQRRMLSPISFHMKSREISSSSVDGESKARGLGVVQKLDFLTSACELLLETTAKEAADRQRLSLTSEDTQNVPNTAELVQSEGSIQTVESVKSSGDSHPAQLSRNTYSLENVSLTLEDAKAAGIPVVDTLGNLSTTPRVKSTPPRSNLMRLNSKSDSELSNGGGENSAPDRSTHSLEDVSRTLDNSKKAGLPVIQALDELTNELAEFSKTVNVTEKSEVGVVRPASAHSSCSAPYPPAVRKAHSLDDIALAVKRAFRSGTSLDDILRGVADEPVKPVTSSSSKDIRPRSVDSGFQSALSDFDVSQSFESSRNRSNTYVVDSSNEELDSTRKTDSTENKIQPYMESSPRFSAEDQQENRRTFTLEHVGRSVDNALTRGIPVVDTLQGLFSKTGQNESSGDKVPKVTEQFSPYTSTVENDADKISLASNNTPSTDVRRSSERKKPVKPKRHSSKKPKTLEANSESFVIEYFSSSPEKEPSKFQIVDNKVQELNSNPILNTSGPSFHQNEVNNSNHENIEQLAHIGPCAKHADEPVFKQAKPALQVLEERGKGSDDSSMQLNLDPNSMVLTDTGLPAVSKERAMWRPSGSVLDKIASLMDVAEDCGISPADVRNEVTHLPCDTEGEIEECKAEQLEEAQVMTSQLAYLRMQLDEKRRHIEAEKFRAQEQWEDQRRRLGQTAFWYVIGKAQGEPEFGEETGNRVVHSDRPSLSVSRFENKLHKAEPELPDQPSPPIAWSSPASSPLPASAVKSSAHAQLFETREYRLSEYPPIDAAANVVRPSSEPAADLAPGPTTPARPSSHEPEAVHYTVSSPRKCWDTSGANLPTPPPFVRRGTAEAKKDIALDHPVASHEGGEAPSEIEVDEPTPCKKGLAMFIGDNTSNQCMTPEIEKKRDRFLRLRQKKQEEERLRKEAELEKKKRKEEKQREKEMLQKMEEERLRVEELERQNAEREWKARQAAEVQPARVPDTYATYRAGPRKQVYEVDDDASNYFVLGPTQSSTTQSGFAEFSGPQCYVKPSGKSNRKIIVNAVSHVCLSGTVNQEQKDKCLQAVSESDGHHFMILFKDGLKFRGLYVHSLDNDQLHKIFGIGPRVVTNKMIEGLYKYNSGGKEFVKIHSKTVSISVDGFAIQKSYWQSGKPSVQSKTSSNLKRPPRQPQR